MGQLTESKGIEPPAPRPPRLLDQVHEAIRRLHYSRRTEEAYVHWIKRFIYWSAKLRIPDQRDRCFRANVTEDSGRT